MTERQRRPVLLDAEDVRTPPEEGGAFDHLGNAARSAIFGEDEVRPSAEEKPAVAGSGRGPATWRHRAAGVFLVAVLSLSASILAIETTSYLLALFDRDPALGSWLGALTLILVASGIVALGGEAFALRKQFRSLSEVAELREDAARLLKDLRGVSQGGILSARVISRYKGRPELARGIEEFARTVTTAHSDAEILSLLARHVVRPLDAEAYGIVSRAARDTGIGVALSPAGLLDAILVIWRTSRMIRDVAVVYGFRPTVMGQLALTRRVLETAAMAGAVEYFGDLLAAHLGAGLAGRLSRSIGQGAFTALRTARLGMITIEACRPLPFTGDDQAHLAALRREIMSSFRDQEDGSG